MKYYFKLLVLLFISIIPINIYAYDLSCDGSTHKMGEVFSCKITGDDVAYDKLSGTIESDASLSCKVASVSPSLELLTSSTDSYFDLSGTASSSDLIIISCEVIDNPAESINATVSVNDFTYHPLGSGVNENTEILKSDYIKIEHKEEIVETDNKPRDISDPSVRPRRLVSKELNITFSQFITTYNVEVLFDTEEISFDYELNDPTSSLRIEGPTKLEVGENVIDIYITNADGSKEACYTFTVTRLARGEEIYYPESDSTLKSMVIPGYSIGFNKDTYEYKIHLTRDVDSVNINTVPNYERATVSISNTDNLKNGDIIAVEVTSADETSKTTYKISITKDAPKKDYSTVIIVTLLALAFVGTIAMFIITNNKKKSDPLLSIKTNKRKVNKGKNFDASIVPETNTSEVANTGVEDTNNETPVNTLNLNTENTVTPIETDKVVVDSFNQVSSTTESVNLNTNVAPTPIVNQNINQIENVSNVPTNVVTQEQPINSNSNGQVYAQTQDVNYMQNQPNIVGNDVQQSQVQNPVNTVNSNPINQNSTVNNNQNINQ